MSCRGSNDTNLKTMIQKILQDINGRYKNSKRELYYEELISKSKNKTKTAWKIMKKEIGTNNCHNVIKYLKIKNTILNDWGPRWYSG